MNIINKNESECLIEQDKSSCRIHNCNEIFFFEHADEFAQLCRLSFAEHDKRNVKMGPCYMTREKWIEHSKGCIGQYIEENGVVIAFWLVLPNYITKEAYGKILAVSPAYKGKHLGFDLSVSMMEYLADLGMKVFKTDTSLKAPHVVKFHKSYGCKAVGMTSWSNTNYFTVILRLALNPRYEISDYEAKLRFFLSKIKCILIIKEDGSITLFGKFYKFVADPIHEFVHKLRR